MAEVISKEQFASLIKENQTTSSVLKDLPDLITELKKLTTTLTTNTEGLESFTSFTDYNKTKKDPDPVTISDLSSVSYKKLEGLFKIIRIENDVVDPAKSKTADDSLLQAVLNLNKKISKLSNKQNVIKIDSKGGAPKEAEKTLDDKNTVQQISLLQDINKALSKQKVTLPLVNKTVKLNNKDTLDKDVSNKQVIVKPTVTVKSEKPVEKTSESKVNVLLVSLFQDIKKTLAEQKIVLAKSLPLVNKPIVTDKVKETNKTVSNINKITTNELLVNKPIKLELKETKKTTKSSSGSTTKDKIENAKSLNKNKQESVTAEKSATDIALETKEPEPFILFDIGSAAYKKLEALFNAISGKQVEAQAGGGKKPQKSAWGKGLLGDLLSKINIKDLLSKSAFGKVLSSGLLTAIGGLGASLALAIGSWFNDGPWKGTMKLVGEIGTKIFLPKVTKIMTQFFPKLFSTFTKGMQGIGSAAGGLVTKLLPTAGVLGKLATKFLGFLTPLLKRLPVIGTIINIGSAISRFISGDIIGGLIDIGSAIAVLIPGVGTAISIGLGLLNAGRDLTGESKKSTGEQVANIGSILGKAMDWIKGKIKDVFNYYFGKLTRGVKQIKSGDYIRGLVTLASFVPGMWWLETVYNWLAGPPPVAPEDKDKKEELPSDVVSKAYDWVKDKLKGLFSSYFGKLSRGIKQIKSGDYIRGIATLASFVPGMWWLESVYNWLVGTPPVAPEDKDKKEELPSNVVGEAYDWVKSKLKNLFTGWFGKFGKGWDLIKSGNYFQGIVVWASTIPGFGWLSSLYDWIAGPEEAPGEEGAEESIGFDWKKIYTAIKDSIKKKLRSVLDKLKKLPFVPNKLVDKIAEFLGLDEKAEEDAAPAPAAGATTPPPKVPTTGAATKEATVAAVTGEATVETAATSNITGVDSLPTPDQVVGTDVQAIAQVPIEPAAPATVEQQAVQAQQDSAARAQQALDNVKAPDIAQIPLPTLPTPATDNKQLLSTLTGMFEKMTPADNKKITTMATNSVANADNSTVNVYNSSSERDIPYAERNKYRQQLLYIRGIL